MNTGAQSRLIGQLFCETDGSKDPTSGFNGGESVRWDKHVPNSPSHSDRRYARRAPLYSLAKAIS